MKDGIREIEVGRSGCIAVVSLIEVKDSVRKVESTVIAEFFVENHIGFISAGTRNTESAVAGKDVIQDRVAGLCERQNGAVLERQHTASSETLNRLINVFV